MGTLRGSVHCGSLGERALEGIQPIVSTGLVHELSAELAMATSGVGFVARCLDRLIEVLTLRDAIEILREYGVSQMPVVGAEPPITAGEVAGSVSERELLSAVFEGRAKLADSVAEHMSPALPLIGVGESIGAATKAFGDTDALMVIDDGKPVGVITRHDLLGFISAGS